MKNNINWLKEYQEEKLKKEIDEIFNKINQNYLKLIDIINNNKNEIKNFNNEKCIETFKITKNKCNKLIKLKEIFNKYENIFKYIKNNKIPLNISELLLDLKKEELKNLNKEIELYPIKNIEDFVNKLKKLNKEIKYKTINIKLNEEEYELFLETKEKIKKIIKENKVTNKQVLFYLIYDFISSN